MNVMKSEVLIEVTMKITALWAVIIQPNTHLLTFVRNLLPLSSGSRSKPT
jgi:hypothetical protein